jgi:chaperonin GroEL
MSSRPARQIKLGQSARTALAEGVSIVARTVEHTLGPRGRFVVLDSRFGTPELSPSYIDRHLDAPLLADDGHAISQEILVADTFVNQGILLARDAGRLAKRKVGDGSTTAIILTDALVKQGITAIAAGADPRALERGIDRAVDEALEQLKASAQAVNNGELGHVATAAARGDRELGGLIAQALERTPVGHIRLEPGRTHETTLATSSEYVIDRGLLTPAILTDHERVEAHLEDALVLLVDARVTRARDLAPALEIAASSGRPLLIIGEEFEPDAMAMLTVNFLQRRVTAVPIQSPGYGESRREAFEDLAAITGATVVGGADGVPLAEVTAGELGGAEQVTVRRRETAISGGHGAERIVAIRSAVLAQAVDDAENVHERDALDSRRALIDGTGVTIITVGGATDTEVRGRVRAGEDALAAGRAARADGIVAGAGVALVSAADAIDLAGEGDERNGRRIVASALEAPTRALAKSIGLEPGAVVESVRRAPRGHGPDILNGGALCDLAAAGIIDAVATLTTALGAAAYYAKRILGSEGLIVQPIYAGRYRGTEAEGGPANLTMS